MFSNRVTQWLIVGLVLFGWQKHSNAEFDPTRPPQLTSKPVVHRAPKAKINPQDYKVTSILISGQRKVAVVNNQVVTLGESVKAADNGRIRVKSINPSTVTLVKGNQVFEVRLPSVQLSKTLAGKRSGNRVGKAVGGNSTNEGHSTETKELP